jgi:hypothetical protein
MSRKIFRAPSGFTSGMDPDHISSPLTIRFDQEFGRFRRCKALLKLYYLLRSFECTQSAEFGVLIWFLPSSFQFLRHRKIGFTWANKLTGDTYVQFLPFNFSIFLCSLQGHGLAKYSG